MENSESKKARNQAFGLRLKTYRQKVKLTQEALAEKVGKSSETISKLERGLIYPGVDMLILLAETLNTSLDSLVGRADERKLTKSQTALMAEAISSLDSMDEDKLKVASIQLKALSELNPKR